MVGSEIARLAGSKVTPGSGPGGVDAPGVRPRARHGSRGAGPLLDDPDADVVEAALAAVRWPEDADLLPEAARHIHDRRTAEAAIDVLVRAGEDALPVVAEGLSSTELDRRVQELFVRVARDAGGPSAVALLRDHIDHRDPDIGLAVMRALAALGSAASGLERRP